MSLSSPRLQDSHEVLESPSNADNNPEKNQTTLQKLADIELLPELFAILQSVENGEIKGQDFDNHAGSIRLKLSNLKSYLQEVDGICETVEKRKNKIEQLKDCNKRMALFMQELKDRASADLERMGNK